MTAQKRTIRIGTRGSPLALTQVDMVCAALAKKCPEVEVEIVVIKTSGDWNPGDDEVRLSEKDGGKGQFAKEIEQALLDGEIDAAVHSMKDMDSNLPDGLIIDHMLEREDARDALLVGPYSGLSQDGLANYSQKYINEFEVLPHGCVVGSASVRRAAFLLFKRPDLKIVPFRGNVQTRIDKLRGKIEGAEVGCTLLAMAGMNRLGVAGEVDVVLDPEVMLPAAGQGAVGVECREGDDEILSIFSHISDLNTIICVKAEREVLRVLGGSCRTPIGAYAMLGGDELWLRVCVVSLDGRQRFEDEIRGAVASNTEGIKQALDLGRTVGERLKARIPRDILQSEIL